MPRHPSCALSSLTTKLLSVFCLYAFNSYKVVLPACIRHFPYFLPLYLSMNFQNHILNYISTAYAVAILLDGGRTWI